MSEFFLPKQIRKHLAGMDCKQNNVGYSQANVYRFYSSAASFFLKIEPKSGELEKEYKNINWLHGRISVPEIIDWVSEGDNNYLLLSEMGGKMLSADYYLQNPLMAVSVLSKGIRSLQSIPIDNCPINNGLDIKLRDAAESIKHNRVDMEDWETSTREKFSSPQGLLDYLCENKPEKTELAFTHGDYCFDNIFGENDDLKGFIDMGRAGVADLWQDLALGIRSLWHNFNTKEYDYLFLEQLGITLNKEKLDYYILLDELF